jgi:hypothetical protein
VGGNSGSNVEIRSLKFEEEKNNIRGKRRWEEAF